MVGRNSPKERPTWDCCRVVCSAKTPFRGLVSKALRLSHPSEKLLHWAFVRSGIDAPSELNRILHGHIHSHGLPGGIGDRSSRKVSEVTHSSKQIRTPLMVSVSKRYYFNFCICSFHPSLRSLDMSSSFILFSAWRLVWPRLITGGRTMTNKQNVSLAGQ